MKLEDFLVFIAVNLIMISIVISMLLTSAPLIYLIIIIIHWGLSNLLLWCYFETSLFLGEYKCGWKPA
jgi:hypothetical protein